MYHMNLKELTVGQLITGYYILRSRKTVTTSEVKPFYCATVLDGSGTMDVRCWQDADNSVDEKTIGEVAYLEGKPADLLPAAAPGQRKGCRRIRAHAADPCHKEHA